MVSALEGGYRIQGGPVSAFARSVAAHVRALSARHSQAWHPANARVRPYGSAALGIYQGLCCMFCIIVVDCKPSGECAASLPASPGPRLASFCSGAWLCNSPNRPTCK